MCFSSFVLLEGFHSELVVMQTDVLVTVVMEGESSH